MFKKKKKKKKKKNKNFTFFFFFFFFKHYVQIFVPFLKITKYLKIIIYLITYQFNLIRWLIG
jgi:hypothetical protein